MAGIKPDGIGTDFSMVTNDDEAGDGSYQVTCFCGDSQYVLYFDSANTVNDFLSAITVAETDPIGGSPWCKVKSDKGWSFINLSHVTAATVVFKRFGKKTNLPTGSSQDRHYSRGPDR